MKPKTKPEIRVDVADGGKTLTLKVTTATGKLLPIDFSHEDFKRLIHYGSVASVERTGGRSVSFSHAPYPIPSRTTPCRASAY